MTLANLVSDEVPSTSEGCALVVSWGIRSRARALLGAFLDRWPPEVRRLDLFVGEDPDGMQADQDSLRIVLDALLPAHVPGRVVRLDIGNVKLDDESAHQLRAAIERSPTLESLTLASASDCQGVDVDAFLAAAAGNPAVREVCLDCNNLVLGESTASLFSSGHVEEISLQGVLVPAEGARRIAQALLSRHCAVHTLVLGDAFESAAAAAIVATAAGQCGGIRSLELSNSRLGSEGLQGVCAMLESSPRLTRLALPGNEIGVEDCQLLGAALAKNSTLVSLDLSNNSLEDVRELVTPLRGIASLERLNLRGTDLGKSNGNALGKLLRNTRLKSIDLSWNELRAEDVVPIFDALGTTDTLLELDLAWNGIAQIKDDAFAGLKRNRSLRGLNLQGNPGMFSSELGVRRLIRALETNNQLRLDLGKTGMDGEQTAGLARAIATNSGIAHLVCPDAPGALEQLAAQVEHNYTIREFELDRDVFLPEYADSEPEGTSVDDPQREQNEAKIRGVLARNAKITNGIDQDFRRLVQNAQPPLPKELGPEIRRHLEDNAGRQAMLSVRRATAHEPD